MKRYLVSLAAIGLFVFGQISLGHAQKGATRTDPNLMTLARTGQVLQTHSTKAIFWGSAWADPAFAGDVITGMDTFFRGFGGSRFARILTEYTDGAGRPISALSAYNGHVIDLSQPPAGALSNATVIAEACSMTNNNPDPNGVYFVYTSTAATLPGTCAIQSYGTCGKSRVPIQVVYAPYMTGEAAGCSGVLDHGDDGSLTGHSNALGQYGNVTANHLMNTVTNPRGTGWKDAYGYGISFKCDGIFLPDDQYGNLRYELFSNGSLWTVRTKWSNAAYRAGTGVSSPWGLPGCAY
jgi:hypothetical protein